MSPSTVEEQYDAIIVGAGAAGLSAALAVLRDEDVQRMKAEGRAPKILVVSKLQALRSHTGSAEGGIAASLGNIDHDDWHWHYYDTVKGGDWLVDQDAALILAREAPRTVIELEHDGVAFSRTEDGHIAQRRFGGHTADYGKEPVRRAAYAADRIGHQILYALWQQCVAEGVQFAEEWYVTDLVLDDQPTDATRDDETAKSACGIVAVDTHTGTVHALAARNVLLATGGAGRLFHTTSNSWDLTGDGMALALDAGLQLEDIEFVQFHPTGLAHTGILLSEASRGEGGVLRNADGEAFMRRYAPEHADLAARDVVSRSIAAEVDAGRGIADPKDPDGPKDCVWLDMTGIAPQRMKTALPQVLETIRRYAGLDPTHDWVPVKPTAHYTMGGIPITTEGNVYQWTDGERRNVIGLYAAGECSCVSVHGANRLGGNSLLDACLFGTRAGVSIAGRIAQAPQNDEESDTRHQACVRSAEQRRQEMNSLLAGGLSSDSLTKASNNTSAANAAKTARQTCDGTNPYALLAGLGSTMERALAVRCNQKSIEKALDAVNTTLAAQAGSLTCHAPSAVFNQELIAIWEVQHLITLAQAMLHASSARHESRGAFCRSDFPKRDDERFLNHTMVGKDGRIAWQPVHIVDMPPQEREY